MPEIKEELISRIISGDTTLEDLNVLKNMFGSSEMVPLRKELVAILGKNLSDEALHKFNSKVMEFSVDLAVPPDTKFMYRTTDMKFFQEMLVLEAKREGMHVELSENGVVENSLQSDIPPRIMEHYSTLSNHLHQANQNANDIVMAEVISWGLTASLARESEYYKKLDETAQSKAELVIAQETEKIKKHLSNTEILDQVKATAATEFNLAKPEESQVKMTTSAIVESYQATQKSLEIIRKSLDSLGPTVKTSHAGTKVERVLLESVKQIPYETLQSNEKGTMEFLKNKLSKKVKNGILTISDAELQQVKEGFFAKCSDQESSMNTGFIAKIVSTFKNIKSYFSEIISKFSRTENKISDKGQEVSASNVNGVGQDLQLEARQLGSEIQAKKDKSVIVTDFAKAAALEKNKNTSSKPLQR